MFLLIDGGSSLEMDRDDYCRVRLDADAQIMTSNRETHPQLVLELTLDASERPEWSMAVVRSGL